MELPTSASRAVASCRGAVARLQEEKAELIKTVLALKATECACWERSLQQEEDFFLRASRRLEAAAGRADSAALAALQQRIDESKRAVAEFQERFANAVASQAELRDMLTHCSPASSDPETPDELDGLVRNLQGLTLQGDGGRQGTQRVE
jgi:hypothetical protein